MITKISNEQFLDNYNLLWPSHMTCFHVIVQEWLDCKYTCEEEIKEFLSKMNVEIVKQTNQSESVT